MLTPFKEHFCLDERGLQENVRFLIDNGARGENGFFIAGGSVGQGFALSMEEEYWPAVNDALASLNGS